MMPFTESITVVAGRLRTHTCDHCQKKYSTYAWNQKYCPERVCQDAKRAQASRKAAKANRCRS